ncbi:MAG: NAD(P)/FAD-dependent oxidoreductase [Chloroflexi bacterium]|nr:NAD(P)/FAD-dependent oxidoreductase [Chloroflexota bacterium]
MSSKKVVVAGGGAAGMLAAGRAAQKGASVTLLEKMERPGKKVLISGNTRCNLTNTLSLDGFISMYGVNGKFLYPAFQRFFREELLELLSRYGVSTFVEPGGRVFPASGKADDVVRVLQQYLQENGAKLVTGTRVDQIETIKGCISAVKTAGNVYPADAVVLATGGSSYPQTGSTGDGCRMAAALGHTIVKLRPALVPLVVKEREQAGALQGISLQDIRLTSFACSAQEIDISSIPQHDCGRGIGGRRPKPPLIESRKGGLIFTQYGVSGPAVLLMSLAVADALDTGPASLSIDLLPAKGQKQLAEGLQSAFDRHGARFVQTILEELVPGRIAATVLGNAGVHPEIKAGRVSARQRESLSLSLKDLRFDIERTRPIAEAMVTAGGVSLAEVDPRTLQSKLVNGLYFCGEMLDIDADTGGFNLQAAFSTGWLAGESAAMLR